MALASRAPSFRPQKHWRGRPLAVSQNVQQILVAKGDLRLQVLGIFLQHSLTQHIGIELASFCKLDDLFGDSFPQNALVAKLKSCASHFEAAGKNLSDWLLANDPTIPAQLAGRAFLDGLRESGFIEGKNIIIERRFAEGRLDQYAALVGELISWKPDVIVTSANDATLGAKR